MRQQKIPVPPALKPALTSCRHIAPGCCRWERRTRIRKFRRSNKQWLKGSAQLE